MMNNTNRISIYIHWPFCNVKCPYCDFNTYKEQKIDKTLWQNAYIKAIKYYSNLLGKRPVETIFFGGGTPSLIPLSVITNIIEEIDKSFSILTNSEISIEVNPCSTTNTKMIAWKNAGINRISIGIQSLRDKSLKFLGRLHSANDAINTIENAKKYFSNISLDMIYALPEQSIHQWEVELLEMISLKPNHCSLYQLTIKNNTPFSIAVKNKKFHMPEDNLSRDLYLITHEIMKNYFFNQYEVSNYSKINYQCRHNMTYWKCGDYLGIGPGAHGRYTISNSKKRYATLDASGLHEWFKITSDTGCGVLQLELLTPQEKNLEKIFMGMRINDGIPFKLINKKNSYLKQFLDNKLISLNKEQGLISATPKGMVILDYIIEKLIL